MTLPTVEEISAARAAMDGPPLGEGALELGRLIREEPALQLDVARLTALFAEMQRPAEALAYGVVVAAMRRGLYYGLVIGELRMASLRLKASGTGGGV